MYLLSIFVNLSICTIFVHCAKLSQFCVEEERMENFHVDFYLSTNVMRTERKLNTASLDALDLMAIKFNPSHKTVIIVHGFHTDHGAHWIQEMKLKLHEWEPTNIILVDWSGSLIRADPYNYGLAARSTEIAAEMTSQFVEKMALITEQLTDWSYLHLIGHSLGAHVVGQTARLLKKNGFIVNRITALDPAYPCFETENVELRLKREDASFIDVIHTNSDPGRNKNFGFYQALGDIDFYPNGGNNQPRCKKSHLNYMGNQLFPLSDLLTSGDDYFSNLNPKEVTKQIITDSLSTSVTGYIGGFPIIETYQSSPYDIICNHGEAAEYFIKSLDRNKVMWGHEVDLPIKVTDQMKCLNRRCNATVGCVEMGINANLYRKSDDKKVSRKYFVDVEDYKTRTIKLDCKQQEQKTSDFMSFLSYVPIFNSAKIPKILAELIPE